MLINSSKILVEICENKMSPSDHHNQKKFGAFMVSLDFELYWGVRDTRSIEDYKKNLQGVRNAINKILCVFEECKIHATWACVGMLFFRNQQHLKNNLPRTLPKYRDNRLSPYDYINQQYLFEEFHFAPDVIQKIKKVSGQEIATHTFSHFYCLEPGQNAENFCDDLKAAVSIARDMGIKFNSIVFPRNQINHVYLSALLSSGINCYRGVQDSLIYKENSNIFRNSLHRRFIRLADTYLNITGHNTFALEEALKNKPYNFPASAFLRPYSRSLAPFDFLKLRRIFKSMEYAAKNGLVYHLWWHPHNFGKDTEKNIIFLKKIIAKYAQLNKLYGMRSVNMDELASIDSLATH